MDKRGEARRQTGAQAGDTDHPQLNMDGYEGTGKKANRSRSWGH